MMPLIKYDTFPQVNPDQGHSKLLHELCEVLNSALVLLGKVNNEVVELREELDDLKRQVGAR